MGNTLFGDVGFPDVPEGREDRGAHRCGSGELPWGAMAKFNRDGTSLHFAAAARGEIDHSGGHLLGEAKSVRGKGLMLLETDAIAAGNGGHDVRGLRLEFAELGVSLGILVEATIDFADHSLAGEAQEVHPHGLRGSEIEEIGGGKNPAGTLPSDSASDLIAFHDKGNISLECLKNKLVFLTFIRVAWLCLA